jgi:hypothetical protein
VCCAGIGNRKVVCYDEPQSPIAAENPLSRQVIVCAWREGLADRGRLAQLAERLVRNEEAGGSSPPPSTNLFKTLPCFPEFDELPSCLFCASWQLETEADSLRPHQAETPVLPPNCSALLCSRNAMAAIATTTTVIANGRTGA